MKVSEILAAKGRKIVTIAPHMPIATAVHLLKKEGIGALVVSDNDVRVLGVITERDIVLGLAKHGERFLDMRVSEVVSDHTETCAPEDDVRTLMTKMTHGRQRHLPVLDAGQLAGVVSIGDVVKSRLSELELETGVLRDAYITHASRV